MSAATGPSPSLRRLSVTSLRDCATEHNAFEIQQDIDDVFLHAVNGRILVQTGDRDFRRCVAHHGGQQDTAQCLACDHSRARGSGYLWRD
jgi:hypothetical protein